MAPKIQGSGFDDSGGTGSGVSFQVLPNIRLLGRAVAIVARLKSTMLESGCRPDV